MTKLIKKLVVSDSPAGDNLKTNTLCKSVLIVNRDLSLFFGLPPSNALIKEAGGYILLEDGSKILLE